MNFIFLGPPGAGKGTIAKYVSREESIPQISTGDLLRASVKAETEIGQRAKNYMDEGKLVPDELVIDLLKTRIKKGDCAGGFILDGFPRTIPQAKALIEAEIFIDKVLNFKASEKILIQRLSGRRTCKNCSAIFHITNIPPKKEGICDKCGEDLFQRDDDQPEAIKKRLNVYKQQTFPLIDFYEKEEILADIDTEKPISEIVEDALSVIK
ncbi:adenylate kinase [Patescibacteria group bacterium]|nr:adenylate kinase [Patescibacteria group bacterium]